MRQLDLIGIACDSVNDGVEALEPGPPAATARCWPTSICRGWTATSSPGAIRAAEAAHASDRTPDHRGDRQRACRRGGALHRGRHGRLLVKPVKLDRLRSTLERWLSVGRTRPMASRATTHETVAAIDRSVLGKLAQRRCYGDRFVACEVPRHRNRGGARHRGGRARRRSRRSGRRRAQAQGCSPVGAKAVGVGSCAGTDGKPAIETGAGTGGRCCELRRACGDQCAALRRR